MNAPRPGTAGATRTCPHCKATILESASVCPACRGHLRFDADAAHKPATQSALSVEGSFQHPADAPPLEYSMVLSIKNERGEEIARQLVGVGALFGGESRSFSLAVEVTEATGRLTRRSGR